MRPRRIIIAPLKIQIEAVSVSVETFAIVPTWQNCHKTPSPPLGITVALRSCLRLFIRSAWRRAVAFIARLLIAPYDSPRVLLGGSR